MKFKMTPAKLMIALFTIVTLAIPITTAVLPKQERSENENRTLEKFPDIVNHTKMDKAQNFSEVMDAIKWDYITVRDKDSWMDDFETYFSDHLAGREDWVRVRNEMEKLVGKKEINGVYTLRDQMIQVFKEYDADMVQKSLDAMNTFAEKHPDMQVSLMLAPTAQELFSSEIPTYAGYLSEKSFIDECYKKMSGMTTIDCLSFLSGHKNDYVFYRTDHHWTSLGAYYASAAYCQANGITPWALGSYDTVIRTGYTGSLYMYGGHPTELKDNPDYSAARFPHAGYSMVYYRDGVQYNGQAVNGGVSDYAGMFLCGDQPLTVITTDNKNGKTLLVFKESYGNAFVPYMIDYYERIVVVDIREEVGSVGDIIAQYGVTDALIINNCQAATSLRSNLESRALS